MDFYNLFSSSLRYKVKIIKNSKIKQKQQQNRNTILTVNALDC